MVMAMMMATIAEMAVDFLSTGTGSKGAFSSPLWRLMRFSRFRKNRLQKMNTMVVRMPGIMDAMNIRPMGVSVATPYTMMVTLGGMMPAREPEAADTAAARSAL